MLISDNRELQSIPFLAKLRGIAVASEHFSVSAHMAGCLIHILRERVGSSDRLLVVDPLDYFMFQSVFHDWYTLSLEWCI